MKRDYLTFKLQDIEKLKDHIGTSLSLRIPFIYCIRCLVNERRYIGYSNGDVSIVSKKVRVARFISHYERLQQGKHLNKFLQEDWNNYGRDNFRFEVLEVFPKQGLFPITLNELLDKEYQWHQQFGDNYSNPSERKVAKQ